MAVTQFGAPIPGQSLAGAKPGERRWERPSEIDTVPDALSYYIERMSDEEITDDMMIALEGGIPIKPLVETLYLTNVMEGKHSLDIGLIVAPVLVELLTALADNYSVNYKLTNKDPIKLSEEKDRSRMALMLNKAMKEIQEGGTVDEGTDILQSMSEYLEGETAPEETEEASPEEMLQEEDVVMEDMQQIEQPPVPEGAGLMARG